MKAYMLKAGCGILFSMALGSASIWSEEVKESVPEVPLTEQGRKLEAR